MDKNARYIGIDIGSVSVKAVIVSGTREILKTWYVRFEGKPLEKTYHILDEIFSSPESSAIKAMAITGTGGRDLAKILNIAFINEVIAQTRATTVLYPEVRTIIEMGGEDSKFIMLEIDPMTHAHHLHDFSMNAICAAGTGSFLDEQAGRLGLSVEDLGKMALRSTHPPRVAGRCSVFAKSDMIHLQQEAVPVHDIVAGLCFALARNYQSSIAKGKPFQAPVCFQGGVAANAGMVRAFRETLKLREGELIIPEHFACMGAIGAAFTLLDDPQKIASYKPLSVLKDYIAHYKDSAKGLNPLKQPQGYLKDTISLSSEELAKKNQLHVYIGIDIGSISTNVIAVDADKRLVSRQYLRTQGRPVDAVKEGIGLIYKELGHRALVKGVGVTGSGRYMIGDFVGADVVKNEITAQARGAMEIDPTVDTIFEIGGQDSKYISIKNGAVCDFEMNKVCAAGTGSFLEEQAERLHIKIKDEFGNLALSSKSPKDLGERCTVFMQSSLNHFQQKGTDRADLAAGLAYSIVYNYLNRVVAGKRVGNRIFFQGAVALNKAVVAAFEAVTGKPIYVPPHNDVTGAIGVALIAQDYIQKTHATTRFKGFDLSQTQYAIEMFECHDCANKCEIRKVLVENEQPLFYGSRCEKYEIRQEKQKVRIVDYFKQREHLLLKTVTAKTAHVATGPTIGIPRALTFLEFLPLWNTFFTALGCKVVLSDFTSKSLIHEGVGASISEHCFPIKVLHGHVLNLQAKGVDHVFLPSVISMKTHTSLENAYACPFVQASPYVVKAALSVKKKQISFLTPTLYFNRGKQHVAGVLTKLGKTLGIPKGKIHTAVEKALKAQEEFVSGLQEIGTKALAQATSPTMVLVGRPYNTCDDGLNLEIPKIFRQMGIAAIPMDFLSLEEVDIAKDWPNMYWRYGQRILSALSLIKANPNLYPVYITNFSCGPDSFILRYFAKEMGQKPYLILEIDEHSGAAGVITRCEAFIDSLHNAASVEKKSISMTTRYVDDIDNRIVYVPFMGNHAYAVVAAFRSCGIQAQVIPIGDHQSSQLGRKYTTGKECYPCILTTGDMLRLIQTPGFDKNKAAFFMPESNGPCRFGQYNRLQRIVLAELGLDDVAIMSPNQASGFYKMMKKRCGSQFDKNGWKGICAVDVFDAVSRKIRPYELHKGQTDKVYQKAIELMAEGIENDCFFEKLEVIRDSFAAIPVDKKLKKPMIGIVGEIYVRSHEFANEHIVNRVEQLGGEVHLPPSLEWLYYVNFRRKEDHWVDKDYKGFFSHYVKDKWQKWAQRKIYHLFDGLGNTDDFRVEDLFAFGNPFLDYRVEGEAPLSVGKAVEFIHHGACGIINIMPFTCMPGTNCSAVLMRVKEEFGVPFLNLSYDGLAQDNAQTRLEAFMHQTWEYMKKYRHGKTGHAKSVLQHSK